jgi:CheY-like chemotaxis protein
VGEVVSLMRVRADAKGLALDVEFDGKIPDSIQSDPAQLRQILINLVGNAVKFTEVGGVRVVARLPAANDEEPGMEFDIVDTGIGLSEEAQHRLFDSFWQADSSSTRRFGGTGLGLAISKRLAEQLGGDITVASTPGRGSTFTLSIATGSLEGVTLLNDPGQTRPAAPGRENPAALAGTRLDCRVLVAEDGHDNQRIISAFLTRAGATVTVAENGQLALDSVRKAADEGLPFDVILMDIQMPVLDGYSAARRLRAEGYTGPIVALTAHAMKEDRQKCLDAGCDDYLRKPIDREVLVAMVRKCAERNQAQREPAASGPA